VCVCVCVCASVCILMCVRVYMRMDMLVSVSICVISCMYLYVVESVYNFKCTSSFHKALTLLYLAGISRMSLALQG
jgi:hypothetical protein